MDKIKQESIWNDETQRWRVPDLVIYKTKLPPAGNKYSFNQQWTADILWMIVEIRKSRKNIGVQKVEIKYWDSKTVAWIVEFQIQNWIWELRWYHFNSGVLDSNLNMGAQMLSF